MRYEITSLIAKPAMKGGEAYATASLFEILELLSPTTF
jgi:hypothetical protein